MALGSARNQFSQRIWNYMKLSGGEAVAKSLVLEGVDTIFGLPGVQMYGLIAGIRDEPTLRWITARHEYATTHMADGYARVTGKPGVAVIVPGVGIYNAGSGLATAYARSSPVLLLAGEVPRGTIGKGLDGLHEIHEQKNLVKPITKWRGTVLRPNEAPAAVNEAFRQLRSGRPRPVFIEMPPEAMVESEEVELLESQPGDANAADQQSVAAAVDALSSATDAVMFVGGGISRSGAFDELLELTELTGMPVVNSAGGKGVIPFSHPNSVGSWVGAAGPIKDMIEGADVIVAVGTRFTPRNPAGGSAKVIHIDPDLKILDRPHPDKLKLQGDAKQTLRALIDGLRASGAKLEEIGQSFDGDAIEAASIADRSEDPQNEWLQAMKDVWPEDAVGVWGMTQLGYYSRQHFETDLRRSYVDSGYMGTLGFAYPTALGAKAGVPDRPVICIVGDGGFGYATGEISTAVRYGLNVIAVVYNDGAYGNVARDLDMDFGGTYETDFANPDFADLARSYGAVGLNADSPATMSQAIKDALAEDGPTVIDVKVERLPRPKAWASRAPWTKPHDGLLD